MASLAEYLSLGLFFRFTFVALPFAFSVQAVPAAHPQEQDPNDPDRTPDDNPAPQDPNVAGASGSSKSNITLSTATIVVIAVVVGIVVILGLASAILFYIAKKRQWELRKSIRKSAKRVTTAIKSATPVRANFSRRDTGMMRVDPPTARSTAGRGEGKDKNVNKKHEHRRGVVMTPSSGTKRSGSGEPVMTDNEKGYAMQTRIEAVRSPTPPR